MDILGTITNAMGGDIATGVAKIIGLFKIDPTVALQKQVEVQEIQLSMARDAAAQISNQLQGQLDINKAEASSTDKFTSRWRPAVGYVCGCALFSNFIIAPFFTWATQLAGHPITYPTLDMSVMMPVLLGMLGLTAGHVYENTQGK